MMGTLYGWATKEYLLERMTFGQIMMYLNHGIAIKYPKPEGVPVKRAGGSLVGASADEIRARREELRRQYGMNVEGL
jgi:hypothetical protein